MSLGSSDFLRINGRSLRWSFWIWTHGERGTERDLKHSNTIHSPALVHRHLTSACHVKQKRHSSFSFFYLWNRGETKRHLPSHASCSHTFQQKMSEPCVLWLHIQSKDGNMSKAPSAMGSWIKTTKKEHDDFSPVSLGKQLGWLSTWQTSLGLNNPLDERNYLYDGVKEAIFLPGVWLTWNSLNMWATVGNKMNLVWSPATSK